MHNRYRTTIEAKGNVERVMCAMPIAGMAVVMALSSSRVGLWRLAIMATEQ